MDPKVCISIPFIQGTVQELDRCLQSVLLNETGFGLEVKIVNESPFDISNLDRVPDQEISIVSGSSGNPWSFARVLETWAMSKAKYVGWVSPQNLLPPQRLAIQIPIMEKRKLAACYGDIIQVDQDLKPEMILRAKEFYPEMVGMECFSSETLLIDRVKFMEAGGFDYSMAACYKPRLYVSAFAVLSGPVEHVSEPALVQTDAPEIYPTPKSLKEGLTSSMSKDLWERIRFETFLIRARHFAEAKWRS